MFIGTVSVDGAKGTTMNAQLEAAAQLTPGTAFTTDKLNRALDQMRQALADNGFREPTIQPTLTPRAADQITDLFFRVSSGPEARVGDVAVSGDAGISTEQFRNAGHLRAGSAASAA